MKGNDAVYTKPIALSAELEEMFWSRVWPYPDTGCLLWMGLIDNYGYGLLCWRGSLYRAHRIAYVLHYGADHLMPGLVIDHGCQVRPCVEWSHLEAVTVSVNVLRGRSPQLARERRWKTHCPKGHLKEGDNLILERQPGGIRRRCRICTYARAIADQQRYRAERKLGVRT
jgi:HNH endonuclease